MDAIIVNGIYITNDVNLTSLIGLQNVTSLPIAYISVNTILNNFCPLKTRIITLSTLPAYKYYSMGGSISRPVLTLTNNGNYVTTPNALAAVALCN